MSTRRHHHHSVLLLIVIYCMTTALHAQVQSVTSGSWSDAATWGGAGIPQAGAVVTIATGTTVTIGTTGLPRVASIIISDAATLMVGTGGSLDVGFSGTDAIEIWGTMTVQGGGSVRVDSATVDVVGALNIGGSGTPLNAASAKLRAFSGGVMTQSGGTITLRDLVLASGAVLNINGGFGMSVGGNAVLDGTVSSGGTMPAFYTLSVSGTASVAGSLRVDGVNFADTYALPAATTFASASVLRYARTSAQNISAAFTFGSIVLEGSGDKTLTGPLVLQQQLTIDGSARFVNAAYPVTCGQALRNNSTALHDFGSATYAFGDATIGGSGNTLMNNASITVSGTSCVIGNGAWGSGNILLKNAAVTDSVAVVSIGPNSFSGLVTITGAFSASGKYATVDICGGNVSMNTITVAGDSSAVLFSGGLNTHSISGEIDCGNQLHIGAPTSVNEDISTAGSLNVTSEFDVSGTLTVGGSLTISGSGTSTVNTFNGAVMVNGPALVISGGVNEFNAGLSHNTTDAASSCSLGGTLTMGTSTSLSVHAVDVLLNGVLLLDALSITNPAGVLEANADVIVRRTVNLAKDLAIPHHTLFVLPGAPMNAMSGNGEVVGTVRRTLEAMGAYSFNSSLTTVSVQGLSAAEEYEVTLVRNLADMQAVMRYYDIQRVGSDLTPVMGSCALGLPYRESELNGNDEATLKLAYGTHGSATENQFTKLPGSTVNTSANIVSYSFDGLTSFNHRYTFGDMNAVLPAELRAFRAHRSGSTVVLRWNTAVEVQNFGFAIERADDPDEGFVTIAFLPGQGTKHSPTDYHAIDPSAPRSAVWYRLRQIDRDGGTQVSDAIGVGAEKPEFHIDNYPNPFPRSTTVTFTAAADGDASVCVRDAWGRMVLPEQTRGVRRHQSVAVPLDLGNLPAGVYFCTVRCGDVVMHRRLCVRR